MFGPRQMPLNSKRSQLHTFLFIITAHSGLVGKQKLTKMKKIFLFSLIALLVSCVDYTDDINAIDERLDALEQSVPSIEEQISAIQTSIKALEEIDKSLDESIKALEASDEATAEEIVALKEADKAIETKIENLKKYVDDALKSTKDWVSTTFATLEQLNALSSEVTALKSFVDANKTEAAANLATAITNLETSLKSWVGEQLSNYYTIAEIDAKIATLEKAIADGDKALQEELNTLKSQLESAKKELTEAYKKAIEEAITENNGVINTKIANEIAAVNKRIDEEVVAINAKIAALQVQVDKNSSDIAKLLARIQSVSYVPQYSDGKALVTRIGAVSEVIFDFKVSPKECVAELEKVWSEALSCEAVYTKTRAVSLVKMAVTKFEADAENGVITVTASGENLSEEFFAGIQEASVALVISDENNSVTSEYVPMVTKEITDEIWYTTTDNQPLTPNKEGVDIFGANIVSNIYKNGKGVIKFDGEVTKIGYNAFLRCASLNNVVMPNSVVEISSQAFAYCNSLKNAIIPKNVMSIEERAFRNCTKLSDITIPDSVIKIGREAFNFCTTVKYITIGKGVNTISEYAFSHCFSVKAFYGKFASEDNRCLIVENTLEAFASSGLTEYTIPDGVTTIASGAFSQHNLEYITLPNSLQSIESSAFSYCDKLIAFYGPFVSNDNRCIIINGELVAFAPANINKYIIPDNATHICMNTFGGCVNLTEISIPEGVKTIGSFAFARCSALKTITIPESVISIGESALGSCTSLTEVYCKPTTPPTGGSDMFDSNASGRKIYVPIGSGEAYKAKSYWSDYADSIEEKEF